MEVDLQVGEATRPYSLAAIVGPGQQCDTSEDCQHAQADPDVLCHRSLSCRGSPDPVDGFDQDRRSVDGKVKSHRRRIDATQAFRDVDAMSKRIAPKPGFDEIDSGVDFS